jgi:hypothetical protein
MSEVLQKKRLSIDDEIQRRKAELDALISKATRLGFMLEKLNGHPSPAIDETTVGRQRRIIPSPPINGYNAEWSIWDKVKYILAKQIEPVTKKELIDKIGLMEPAIATLTGKDKRTFSVSISACLSTKFSKGVLRRIESETEDFKYYLPKE